MKEDARSASSGGGSPLIGLLRREDVLSGLLFIAIAAVGLWVSRDYPIGTATRMSTGYVPRLLCWLLLLLGIVTTIIGLRTAAQHQQETVAWRPLVFIPLALVAFALLLDPAGLIIASAVLIGVSALASRELRLVEIVAAAAVLISFVWTIFVWALGLTIQIWPDW